MNATVTCPECGSIPPGGRTCRQTFEAALVLEYENPAVFGRVHHYTVTCYNLQHPSAFTKEALVEMETFLRSMLAGSSNPQDYRRGLGRKFKGRSRVTRHEPAAPVPRRWERTTADLSLKEGPDAFISSVLAWAESIVRDLDHQPR